MNRSIFQCTHWTSRVLSFTFQCCCSQLYSHVVLASSYISKENELMMYLHCKMIDLKDLNIVYRCQNQHCSSYSSCLLVKFINWRCVLLTERKSVRPFFFSFQRNRQAPSMAQSVKQPLSCQVYQHWRISFSLFLVIHFSQRVSNWSLVSKGHTFQMQIYVELQFFQKGNEQLHKLPVCWIWKRMN